MERWLIDIFNKLAGAMGPGLALALVLIVGVCATLCYGAKLVLAQWIADMASKRAEREQQARMLTTMLTNHVQHIAAAQDGFVTFQREISENVRAATDSLHAIHKEVREARSEGASAHVEMSKDLSRIEGRLDK